MNRNRQVKHYLRQVSRLIPSTCIGKKDICKTIRHRVEAYFLENPDASMHEFTQEFGTPEELAEFFLDEMSGAQLMTDLNRRRRNTVCIGGCLVMTAALLAAYAVFVSRNTAVGIVETITIYEDPDNIPEDFETGDEDDSEEKTK